MRDTEQIAVFEAPAHAVLGRAHDEPVLRQVLDGHVRSRIESPREAAQRAATTLRNVDVDDECAATVFDVYERRAAGRVERTGMRIDLSNETENRAIRFRVDTMP